MQVLFVEKQQNRFRPELCRSAAGQLPTLGEPGRPSLHRLCSLPTLQRPRQLHNHARGWRCPGEPATEYVYSSTTGLSSALHDLSFLSLSLPTSYSFPWSVLAMKSCRRRQLAALATSDSWPWRTKRPGIDELPQVMSAHKHSSTL